MFNTKIIILVRVCFENRFWTVGAASPLVLVVEPLLGVKLTVLGKDIPVGVHLPLQFTIGHPATGRRPDLTRTVEQGQHWQLNI